jgi:hypothetical protein
MTDGPREEFELLTPVEVEAELWAGRMGGDKLRCTEGEELRTLGFGGYVVGTLSEDWCLVGDMGTEEALDCRRDSKGLLVSARELVL